MSYFSIPHRFGRSVVLHFVSTVLPSLILAAACNDSSFVLGSTEPKPVAPDISGSWIASVSAAFPHPDLAGRAAGTCSIADFQFVLEAGPIRGDSIVYSGSQGGITMLCHGVLESARAVFGMEDTVVVVSASALSGTGRRSCWIFEGCFWRGEFRFRGFRLEASLDDSLRGCSAKGRCRWDGQLTWSDSTGVPRVEGSWEARR